MVLDKVISGGQSGADHGGLVAARKAGVATGGWMPRGFRTLDGPKPGRARLYGLREHPSPAYPPRTFANARDADATVRFAVNWSSPGELCTSRVCRTLHRPMYDVDMTHLLLVTPFVRWLREHDVSVLNVAGHSEQSHPGTRSFVKRFLALAFAEMEKDGC